MSVRKNKNLARRIHIFLLAGAMAFVTAAPVYAIPTNTQLPSGFKSMLDNSTYDKAGNTGNIHQTGLTAVNKWGDFSIGADAVVNFTSDTSNFNSVNFVNNGKVSEIYGQINANGGNIFLANTAGVQIGGSAQINVGSLYVTNKDLSSISSSLSTNSNMDTIKNSIANVKTTNAELMSLGGIVTEGNVTFDGDRVVIDVDHLYKNTDGAAMDTGKQLTIKTTDANNVVLGYTAYDETNKTYAKAENKKFKIFQKKDDSITEETVKGYMWVENLQQLQAMGTKLDGNYALRNSIDANYSKENGFVSVGNEGAGNAFIGRFDGLGYDIFDLNVKDSQDYAGLFGYVNGAIIRNFTLNSGSVAGGENIGAAVGYANNSTISNIINTADVTGTSNVGGLVGYAENSKLDGLVNTGTVTGTKSNIGGIAGNITISSITGETYNLGAVTGSDTTSNVGGIVGSADASTIGNAGEDAFVIYNELTVTGGYNVGGIAGKITGSDTADGKTMVVQNVANEGAVLAKGYDNDKYSYHSAFYKGIQSIDVKAANAGGIVGNANNASVSNAENSGDVTTTMTENSTTGNYYNAGNVGGIIGRAEDTDITTVVNKENNVAGAHNVGGAVGYLTGNSKVDGAINNGGDITATGARKAYTNTFAQESVRESGSEVFNIGNIGGIVGYMYGDNTQVANSANRGTVHSAYIDNPGNVLEISKAANVGGVVGKLDMDNKSTIDEIKKDTSNASITGSYNTGSVQGYTGVGGVTGFMYNGSVAASYNLGNITTTRQVDNTGGSNIDPLNMGGIVGDTTEQTNAHAVIYDVYNTGQIGDDNYKYFARHVGGIVGRLSGTVEKAYNTGDIYNYDTAVGGIAGWWYNGQIKDVFNTGNITIKTKTELQAGGIVGAAQGLQNTTLSNAYNLGTIRGFQEKNDYNDSGSYISLGGIIGRIYTEGNLSISNVYTMGNLYAARKQSDDNYISIDNGNNYAGNGIEAIVGRGTTKDTTNAFYIKPEADKGFADLGTTAGVTGIEYDQRHNADSYKGFGFSSQNGGDVANNTDDNWRIYDGTTPILNAFLPNAEDYFDQFNSPESLKAQGISSIQYGTAFNPLLTIINANKDLSYNWKDLGITGAAGLAVYGGGLTLNNFASAGDNRYFGGIIYSDGALTLNGAGNNFNLGAGSELYGSSVTLNNKGNMALNGSVTSTNGNINIKGNNIEIIGKFTAAAKGDQTTIAGISSKPASMNSEGLTDPTNKIQNITDRFTHTTGKATENGDIFITANGTAEVLYGHLGTGNVTSGGSLTVKGEDSVYIDTDLHIGGDLNLESNGEMLIDISNMGNISKENLHKEFLDHFKNTGTITVSNSDKFKIAIDLWDNDSNSFKLDKYDIEHTLTDDINNLQITSKNEKINGKSHTYIWINSAEQLKGIQKYKDAQDDAGILGYNFALKNDIDASQLNDYKAIASDQDEEFTGTFDGRDNRIIGLTVGKNTVADAPNSAGIFGTIGTNGVVKDVRIYSSNFYGKDYAGAVAGINNGTITGITTLGNHVEAFGSNNSLKLHNTTGSGTVYVGAAGGIAGINYGNISDISASDSIIAGDSGSGGGLSAGILATAGGIAGINEGDIDNVTADSAITANKDTTYSLGGIAGVNRNNNSNNGTINNAYNTGIVHGEYGEGNITSNSVGGIAGVNTGYISNVYNSADITGGNYVGGIAGYNHDKGIVDAEDKKISGQITNAVNAGDILADFIDKSTGQNYTYTGGLAGYNSGSISSGRNTGEIYGGDCVGGMVGGNASGSVLTNLSNSVFASITGESYVGGIAGENYGNINATDSTINNYGKVYGQHFVGGIAGANEKGGTIANTISSIELNVKDTGTTANYFGGVVGQNKGTINGATNESSVDVAADGATFVGGIIGYNTSDGKLEGIIHNAGLVTGEKNVGGIIGQNDNKKVLQGTEDKRLTVINEGTVKADDGGAAGIFYTNNGLINYADIINKGTVIGGDGATGGLFGTNSGNITNSTLTNSGIVTGGGTVGGLIGENSGTINTSSLKNEAGATVIGINNVGGLIGKNTGTITGGRDDNNNYYKYQIYNNGVINVGKWTDTNKDGVIDAGEFTSDKGYNIGGLIGINTSENGKTGNLSAGYNTGAINAGSSTNVGGIVGNNGGTVDQVFNTVFNSNGTNGTITGATNVGGIIGSNSGQLSNAYNTAAVNGNDVVGAIAGNNANSVSDVYNTWNTNNIAIIGDGTSATNAYNVDSNKQTDYSDLDFNDTWKIYEGNSNPLLSVFLTKVSVNQDKLNSYMNQHKVYNGKNQQLTSADIKALIDCGAIYVDGLTEEEAFEAFYNSNGLISSTEHKDASSYSDWLYSGQIASSGTGDTFNPNNLGYDIDLTASIAKAQIIVDLNDIERTYGDITITNGNYGFNYDFSNVSKEEDKNTLINELNDKLTIQQVNDDALVDNGSKTNNAGDYIWRGTVNIKDGYSKNYEFVVSDGNGNMQSAGSTITTTGSSKVNKRQLSISDIIANIVYGNQDGKGFTVSGGELSNIVYNDDVKLDTNLAVTDANIVSGSNYAANKGNRDTADVGIYDNSLNYTGLGLTGNDADNYYIADTATGTIKVTQATITVDLDDVNRTYGNTDITSGGYNVNNIQGIVNNDTYNRDDFTVTVAKDNALTGNTSGKVTHNAGNYSYTGTVTGNADKLQQNYKIVVNNSTSNDNTGTGNSIINKADLSITINNVNTVYGTAFKEEDYGYSLDGLVNGDKFNNVSENIDAAAGGYNNTAAGSDGKATQNAGNSYSLSFNKDITNKDILENYNITTVNTGTSTVNKATITIGADNVQINLGQKPNYTGTDINDVLVNGDKFNNDYYYGVKDSDLENTVGTHIDSVGIWIGNSFYQLSEGSDWTGSGMDAFFSNYDITFTPGTLTVGEKVEPDYNWDYLYNDNPFDRLKNFRERKAEINFVDGGMEI